MSKSIDDDIKNCLVNFTNVTDKELEVIKEDIHKQTALDPNFVEKVCEKLKKVQNMQQVQENLAIFFGRRGGSGSRKSKQSLKSSKVKSKSLKSRKTQKSRQSKKQSKKIKLEVELSKEMSKRISKKTPMIASSHGISLLKRSKRNMSKGRPLASARDFLLATSILTAALSPYDPHPIAKKSEIAPDTQVHLDWHKGKFPDKQLTSKQYKKLMKRSKKSKKLSTIKEGGGGTFSKNCKDYKKLKQEEDDLPITNIELAKQAIKEISKELNCEDIQESMISQLEVEPYKINGEYKWVKINEDICEMKCGLKQKGGKWSLKYKRSIDCKRPKGFSQKQYCKRILKKKKKKRTKKNRKKRTKRTRRK
tara:strand:+ start:59 stop:1150 length:1092 start_codon:yes stop_codon:yes gene_type:complete